MGRKQNTEVLSEDRGPKDHKLTRPGALTLVLYRPRIPQNTGSIARLCAATGSRLDLVAPFFKIEDSKLKRAGLDYWPLLDVRIFESLQAWQEQNKSARVWYLEVGGTKNYVEASYEPGDFLFFGDEQEGVEPELLQNFPTQHLSLPQQGVRSLNLAMTAGIVTYEALRHLNWLGLKLNR